MKSKTNLHYFLFLLFGLSLVLQWSCKKSSSSDNIITTGGTVTDIDGNVYHTVTIGTQVWMAENLKTTKYRNGTTIPQVSDSLQWSALTIPGTCYYNNDANMLSTYGRLYNWYAVADTVNNIAPTGWHVPSDAEWTVLETYLGTGNGGKMKVTGTTYWNSPNAGATNSSGFNGLGGGDRSNTGMFHYLGEFGCFWSITESSATQAWEHVLSCNSSNVIRMEYSKGLGISVRCIKD